jgi:excisionase family DNA binding protein
MPNQPPIIFNNQRNQALVEAFHRFGISGCGWKVFDYAVTLEPILPKIAANPIQTHSPLDDAQIQSRFRLFGRQNNQRLLANNQSTQDFERAETTETPAAFYREEKPIELQVFLSANTEVAKPLAEQMLMSFSNVRTPTGFEILASGREIILQIATQANHLRVVKENLKTYFPDVYLPEKQNFLENTWQNASHPAIADFGLARNFLYPLESIRLFNPDPLLALFSSLSTLNEEERAVFQVLFQPLSSSWTEAIQKLPSQTIFKDLPESSSLQSALKQKLTSPLFAVVLRLAVSSESLARSWQLIKQIGGSLACFSSPSGNQLIALDNTGISPNNHLASLINRTSYRSGMILNVGELASFAHLPSASVKSTKLKRNDLKTKAAPTSALGHPFILGQNEHQGETKAVSLSEETRTRHLLSLGATGSGKTNALLYFALQNIRAGRGCAVFDSHGDLIDEIVANIPPERSRDIVLFDPGDSEYPIGFNPLIAHSEIEKTLLTSDLTEILRRFSTSWGDLMSSVCANSVLAFVESSQGGNLFDLKRFLIEPNFRSQFLTTVNDEAVKYFWQNEFPLIKGKPQSSIVLRLDTFLRNKLIRNIICQKEKTLNFRQILDNGKIFLAKLPLGIIGEQNSYLLGTLLLSKLQQTALSRQDTANRPFYNIYADEFHHLICPTVSTLLSGIRKFRVGLSLFLQQFRQIQEKDSEVAASVLANCATRICFRLGDEDAHRFQNGFSFFSAENLQNLPIGEAIARIERADYDFNLKIPLVPKVPKEIAEQRKKVVLANSREQFATSRIEVEGLLFRQPVSAVASPPIIETPQNESVEIRLEPKPPQAISVGRGGQHHQQIQSAIKRMAESYGFTVEIEKEVLDGNGKIDVSLQKENLKIAAEVSVTTTDYEAKNVSKCLASGYAYVVVICSQVKKIPLIQNKIFSEISVAQREQVKVLSLPNFFAFLRDITFPKDANTKKEKPNGQRMSFAEAYEFLGVGSSTLYRWIREGRIPFYRIGREYQFDREELVLIGRHDLSGKRKATVKLEPLQIEKTAPKSKKKQDARYRKLLNLE